MAEIYIGTKFKYKQVDESFSNHSYLEILKYWCNIFSKKNFAPPYSGGSSGNLSFRKKKDSNNFIITASHTSLNKKMIINDFTEVTDCDIENNIVYGKGLKEPSSEAIMHFLIYKNRTDVNAIFHGHSSKIMQLAIQNRHPETKKEFDYGTIELAKEVTNTLKKYNFVILKNHGFISVGENMEQAGNRVLHLIK